MDKLFIIKKSEIVDGIKSAKIGPYCEEKIGIDENEFHTRVGNTIEIIIKNNIVIFINYIVIFINYVVAYDNITGKPKTVNMSSDIKMVWTMDINPYDLDYIIHDDKENILTRIDIYKIVMDLRPEITNITGTITVNDHE